MKLIVLANGKGGCGKTTVATTLASALAVSGRRVALADADPQRSSLTWLGRRPAQAAPIGAIDWTGGGPRSVARVMRLAERSLDWLILDAPTDLMRNAALRRRLEAALIRADAVIAPTTPSVFDTHATRQFLAAMEAAQSTDASTAEVLLVTNRVPKSKRRAAADLESNAPADMMTWPPNPIAALREHRAYRRLAAAGLALFDAENLRLAAHRAEWRPLLSALKLG